MSTINLQTLRKQRGISQRELADALGCSFQLISKIENGARAMTEEMREKLAAFYSVEPGDIEQHVARDPRGIYMATKESVVLRYMPESALEEALKRAIEQKDWSTAEIIAGLLKEKG